MPGCRDYQKSLVAMLGLCALLACAVILLSASAGADTGTPKRLADVKAGDCMGCHAGGSPVLPEKHPDTKAMTFEQCMACHAKDEVALRSKMPTSHAHMLSGVSCKACHGEGEPSGDVGTKTCTMCHPTADLAKKPAKGVNMPNPHNSHYGTELDCDLCHYQHRKSENMCLDCHDFKNVTPSPIAPLSFQKQPEKQQ
jgi:hypothetical protein